MSVRWDQQEHATTLFLFAASYELDLMRIRQVAERRFGNVGDRAAGISEVRLEPAAGLFFNDIEPYREAVNYALQRREP